MGKEELATKAIFKKQFISKNELLSWLNSLLQIKLTLVEQLGSGSVYCQILDVVHPGSVPLLKVKWQAKVEYDFLHNFRLLQQGFDKFEIAKNIPANKLAKTKYQDNLEFGQWMKGYFDMNCKEKGKGYNPVIRRGNQIPDFSFCKGGVLPKQTLFFRNPNDKSQQSHMFMEECSIGVDNSCLHFSNEKDNSSKKEQQQVKNIIKNNNHLPQQQPQSESKTLNTSFFSDKKEASTNNSFDFKESFAQLNKPERQLSSRDIQSCQFFTRSLEDNQENNKNNTVSLGTISAQLNNITYGFKEANDQSSLIASQHTQLDNQFFNLNNQSTIMVPNPTQQINFFGREDKPLMQEYSITSDQKNSNNDNNISTANIRNICQIPQELQNKNSIFKKSENFNQTVNSDSSYKSTLQQNQLSFPSKTSDNSDKREEINLRSALNLQNNSNGLEDSKEFPIKKTKIDSNIFFLSGSDNAKVANSKSSQMKVQQIKDIFLGHEGTQLQDYDNILKQIFSICNSN